MNVEMIIKKAMDKFEKGWLFFSGILLGICVLFLALTYFVLSEKTVIEIWGIIVFLCGIWFGLILGACALYDLVEREIK